MFSVISLFNYCLNLGKALFVTFVSKFFPSGQKLSCSTRNNFRKLTDHASCSLGNAGKKTLFNYCLGCCIECRSVLAPTLARRVIFHGVVSGCFSPFVCLVSGCFSPFLSYECPVMVVCTGGGSGCGLAP